MKVPPESSGDVNPGKLPGHRLLFSYLWSKSLVPFFVIRLAKLNPMHRYL